MSIRKCAVVAVICSVIILLNSPSSSIAREQQVKMWETQEVIPIYLIGAPDPNPIFYNGRRYQGAKGRVYPYPLLEKLTNDRVERKHTVIYMENEYLKVGLMPDGAGGGRIFTALDKTNGYDLFYRQSVIKPGLIGVLGAWWSGGVEWNVPHHHRTSTYLPVDYTLKENPDGSKTVWMGEIEISHRLKWMVGVTLHPGKSLLEVSARVINRTPLVQSFLFWANVAVHTDSSYQIIFPPSLEYGTGHGKHIFTTWPLAPGPIVIEDYGYKKGDDLSWWKNHPMPISIFAIGCEEDFMAGYNHGKQAGVVHVADHHIVPGKKLWQWGPGEVARMWDR
ncbi:MAG: DUF5107 domain-containing protein, partial [Gemmatimonadota bacterium]|nr:DUF5107 domain-containing protein [Gemmatimonadota bacterium]